MQILEASAFGLRTARMAFRNHRSPVSVTLFPMVHVGEARFYREAYEDAFGHDVVLVEGVRSPVVRRLTRSYRWLNLQKLGLVLESRTRPRQPVSARIVRADLSSEEFHGEWRKIPLYLRALFYVMVPLVGIHRRLRGSRERLAAGMSLEDLPSAEEILSWSPEFEPVYHSILHARDKRLIECLAAEMDAPAASEKRIAVVYGARHMRAVVRELGKRGFHCTDASWKTIFSM